MAAVIVTNRESADQYSWTKERSSSAQSLAQALSSEIIRKLKTVAETVLKSDAESVCEDVFQDIIGTVELKTREALETQQPCCFYEVLADYYAQNVTDAEILLDICRTMWAQSFIVSIYSLLLHKWILENEDAGGISERHKHLNVLSTGCQQLFWTDLVSCTCHFSKLFDFLYQSFTLKTNKSSMDAIQSGNSSDNNKMKAKNSDCLSPNLHRSFLCLLAQFMPYYLPLDHLSSEVLEFPFTTRTKKLKTEIFSAKLSFTYDDFFHQITETLKKFDGRDPGLLTYLRALCQLKNNPLLAQLRTVTSLRFQAQLYSLTSQGGPRYAPWKVRNAAFSALDALYPAGSRTRKFISQLFRILHPLDWPRTISRMCIHSWKKWISIFMTLFSWIYLIFALFRKLR